eukprot:m.352209 g.352209  ORF g.352209 m.352209 type:complete len:51 (+) comp16464_c0_seq1:44-196(+)
MQSQRNTCDRGDQHNATGRLFTYEQECLTDHDNRLLFKPRVYGWNTEKRG